MKIRIKGNSIRFRLTKTEVATLCEKGYVEETTYLDPHPFRYAVQRKNIASLEASFKDNTMVLSISNHKLQGWEKNEIVGFETTIPIDANNNLDLLLEKDFVCLDERLEDQSDNYPNPKTITP
ncbi:MAG: hypothetical protein HKP53_04565 [Eudoraea sp.]|nr:hypothetical protein [Eudoraea sp.]